ncbi:MAG: hypothetical protein CMH83_03795 [Nocardioides sp.]|nr:hypothetical protein [Nocardioides sp.]
MSDISGDLVADLGRCREGVGLPTAVPDPASEEQHDLLRDLRGALIVSRAQRCRPDNMPLWV